MMAAVAVVALLAFVVTSPAPAVSASGSNASSVTARTGLTATKNSAAKEKAATARTAAANVAASRARARVDALLERYQAASAQVDVGLRALNSAFAADVAAEANDDEAAARRRRALVTRSVQVRAVYAAGGPAGLAMSVLSATSPDDAIWRVSTADRVLGTLFAAAQDEVVIQAKQAAVTRRRAIAADAATDAQARALKQLQQRAGLAATALTQAQAALSALDARARQAKAAQEAALQIAAARAAARSTALAAIGEMTALAIPAEYRSAYQTAALTCPGMAWTLLAGVGQVESGHGRNTGPSSAGAIGPMQFMPRTFAAFAVDGDQDSVLDAWDPQDAIFSAANYLCASGARATGPAGSAAWKQAALLAYNHAQWYVDLVLAAEQAIVRREAALGLGPARPEAGP